MGTRLRAAVSIVAIVASLLAGCGAAPERAPRPTEAARPPTGSARQRIPIHHPCNRIHAGTQTLHDDVSAAGVTFAANTDFVFFPPASVRDLELEDAGRAPFEVLYRDEWIVLGFLDVLSLLEASCTPVAMELRAGTPSYPRRTAAVGRDAPAPLQTGDPTVVVAVTVVGTLGRVAVMRLADGTLRLIRAGDIG